MERRSHPRVPYGAWVEDLTTGDKLTFFLTKDLSLGGLLLQAPQPPPLGHCVQLRLLVENEERVANLVGEVVRHEPDARAFAVRFVDVDEHQRAFIEELVADRMARRAHDEPTVIQA